MSDGGDGWDQFDWDAWGVSGEDLDGSGEDAGKILRFPESGRDDESPEPQSPESQGQWITSGGIVHWEEPDESDQNSARAEATSVWAADEVDLPLGAPDALRIRSVRAWLLKQRMLESEAIGSLLVERRRIYGTDAPEDNPLDLAVLEHQTAMETYEQLIAELDEIDQHSGPALVLIEFHLWLTEQLAALAGAPEAPIDLAPGILLVRDDTATDSTDSPSRTTSPESEARWRGQADATLLARRRVEQVTTPEPEE